MITQRGRAGLCRLCAYARWAARRDRGAAAAYARAADRACSARAAIAIPASGPRWARSRPSSPTIVDRHRRQSARRGCRPRSAREVLAGAPGAIEIGGRREAIAAAIAEAGRGRHRAARRQGPRAGPDRRRRRGDARAAVRRRRRRAGVRGMSRSRSWTMPRAEIAAAPTGGRRVRSGRPSSPLPRRYALRFAASVDSREVGRRPVRRAEGRGDRRPSLRRQGVRARRGGRDRQRAGRRTRMSCVADTTRRARRARPRRRARGRAAKIVGVTGSVGKTGTKEALFAALDRAAPGARAPLGQELQQPYRRAAEPRADAGATRASACSRWA